MWTEYLQYVYILNCPQVVVLKKWFWRVYGMLSKTRSLFTGVLEKQTDQDRDVR